MKCFLKVKANLMVLLLINSYYFMIIIIKRKFIILIIVKLSCLHFVIIKQKGSLYNLKLILIILMYQKFGEKINFTN